MSLLNSGGSTKCQSFLSIKTVKAEALALYHGEHITESKFEECGLLCTFTKASNVIVMRANHVMIS